MECIIDTVWAGCCWDAEHKSQDMHIILDLRQEADVELDYLSELFAREKKVYINLPCNDGEPMPEGYLQEATDIIAGAVKRRRKILVHCLAGVSRTATVISAYLVAYHDMTPESAILYATERRQCFFPHPDLWTSLAKFAEGYGHGRITEHSTMFKELLEDDDHWVNIS